MNFWDKTKQLISKIDTPVWLEIFFVVIILLRIPSFFEPFNYGDEMIYLTLGQGIRQGVPLYLGLHDNKPPLLYIMAAIAGNLFWFKTLLAAFNLAAIYLFWKLTKLLSPKNNLFQKISTIIFGIFSTFPLLEGNIANAENFMAVPTLLAFVCVFSKKENFKRTFFIGFLFSLASLFKIVAAFDILGLLAFWLILSKRKNFVELVKKVVVLSIGFLIPIAATFVWYWLRGALPEYIVAAYLQNVGYVSSWRPSDVAKPFLEKNAPLLIRASVMFFGFGILYAFRKKLSKQFVFVSAWLLASLFAVALSERPYPHYLLQSLPPISLLLGMLFTYKNFEQSLVVIPLTLAFFVPFYFNFWYYQTGSYYLRFVNFATKRIDMQEYLTSFSSTTPRNYKIADFLIQSSKPSDKIFVWSGDSSTIYALSRRLPPTKYVAGYHFIDFSSKEETLKILSNNLPKFVIITPDSFEFNELKTFVSDNYYLISEIDSAEIWLKLNNGI